MVTSLSSAGQYHSTILCSYANRSRIFRCYPSVAFLDLHTKILEAPESRTKIDVELLKTVAEALSPLKDPSFPQAYYSRLHVGMLWCIRVASTVTKCMDQPSTTGTRESSAGPPDTIPPESVRPTPPPLSDASASSPSSSSSSKVTHTPSQDESTRPRKKPLPSKSTPSWKGKATPRAQKTITATSVPDSGQNIYGARPSASSGEENPAESVSATLLVAPNSDFQDWRLPTLNHDSAAAFVNMPMPSGSGDVYYEAGTFDDFMPNVGSVMEPWDMDFTDDMIMDSNLPKKTDAWNI